MREWPFDTPYPVQMSWLVNDITLPGGNAPPALADLEELKRHPLLDTAVSKVRWGNNHLVALEHNLTQSFADTEDQAVMRADLDPESGDHVFSIEATPDLTAYAEDIFNSVVDVAGCYRIALDKLTWKAVCDFHNGPPRDPPGVKFPIATSTTEWANAGRARNQFDPRHCGFIETFQPYHGVNGRTDGWHGSYAHQLSLLQDLTNDAKHRDDWPVLLPAANASFGRACFSDDFDEYIAIATREQITPVIRPGQPMEIGTEVIRMRLFPGAPPEIHNAARVAPLISLPEGRQVVPTLQRIGSYVHLILSEFAAHFPAQRPSRP